MNHTNKQLVMALTVSVMLVIFNILAVTQQPEENYISLLGQFVVKLMP